jgi:hypothetical protein
MAICELAARYILCSVWGIYCANNTTIRHICMMALYSGVQMVYK